MHSIKVAYKVWLDSDGKAFGEGPCELLRLVEKTGSLHKAAMEMNMSYRKAWLTLRASEKRLGFPLLERTVGGASGGGSSLTPQARRFMKQYEQFRKDVGQAITKIYAKHFGKPRKNTSTP